LYASALILQQTTISCISSPIAYYGPNLVACKRHIRMGDVRSERVARNIRALRAGTGTPPL